jgi:acetyl esterase/lipase
MILATNPNLPFTVYLKTCLCSLSLALFSLPCVAAEPEAISLWEKGKAPDGKGGVTDEVAVVFVHRPETPNGTVVVICPGGGYGGLVMKPEGHGIAEWLNQRGVTGVVLQYRLPKGRSMVPLLDARRAIQLVRTKAAEWGCDPAKIGIAGFSAGGHLAATAATNFEKDTRPDFALLVYPVITMGDLSHGGSRRNLLGENPTPELVKAFSAETLVRAETPPVFLAHAVDDKLVPIDNSRLFRDAMAGHAVPCELLELPGGGHGLNGYKGPMWDAWQSASLKWMEARGFLPKGE